MATFKETAAILGGATQTVWEETAPDVFFTVYMGDGIKVRFSPEYGDWTITSTLAVEMDTQMTLGEVVQSVKAMVRSIWTEKYK